MNLRTERSHRDLTTPSLETVAYSLIIGAAVIAFLYIGREILVPLALASLLSFALWPLIRLLRTTGLGRTGSIFTAVLIAISGLVLLGSVMALQVTELAAELPRYESNLRDKVKLLKGASVPSGAMERAADTIQGLQDELKQTEPAPPPPVIIDGTVSGNLAPNVSQPANATQAPVIVKLNEPTPGILRSYQDLVRPLLSPLTTTALVILFLFFILLQREDLRDRLLRIVGGSDLQRSTTALNDAAERLSRFFVMQLTLNVGFGIFIGIGLALIGVPSPALWGILAALMRFVPYVGSVIAAIFPVALAAAVDPSWNMVILTLGLFLISEPIAGHVLEPMLFGQSTGLSPVAIVISALFWTLLWGSVGLLLATPLTVCLVVLGKHIPALEFITVLLGDEPALAPEQRFYQRLLAGDAADAVELADEDVNTNGLIQYYDRVAMKTLEMAHLDAARGRLDTATQNDVLLTIREITEELDDYDLTGPPQDDLEAGANTATIANKQSENTGVTEVVKSASNVLCIPVRGPLDEAGAELLVQLLNKSGATAAVVNRSAAGSLTAENLTSEGTVVCLSHFGDETAFQVRTIVRRLRRVAPGVPIVGGFWLLEGESGKLDDWKKSAGVDWSTSSLSKAVDLCLQVQRPANVTSQNQPVDLTIPRVA